MALRIDADNGVVYYMVDLDEKKMLEFDFVTLSLWRKKMENETEKVQEKLLHRFCVVFKSSSKFH